MKIEGAKMKTERPIPTEGKWFKRNNNNCGLRDRAIYRDNPISIVRVEKVEQEKERLYTALFVGFDDEGKYKFGRHRWIAFDTWRSNGSRYQDCDAPEPPKPEPVEEPPQSGERETEHEPTLRDIYEQGKATHMMVAEVLRILKAMGPRQLELTGTK